MDERWRLSRRQVLRRMFAAGALTAAEYAWWDEPLVFPRRAWGATPVRFQFSVPEPKRNALVESLVQRFNQAQKDFEARVEFVPQAQARQKLITSIAAGTPPDVAQVWDTRDGKVAINSPQAAEALEWYLDLFRKHKVCPPSVPTDGWRGIVEGFGRGVTNSYIHNSGSSEEQKDFVKSENFATVPLPFGPAKKRYSFYFSETLTGFKAGKNRDGAWKFMSWAMEPEPHYMYSKGLGLLPARKTVAERPEFTRDPALAGFIKSFPFSIVSPYLAYAGWGGKLDSEGVPLFQQALVGKLTAREFLDKFAEVLSKNMS